jgi:hypothetical protein
MSRTPSDWLRHVATCMGVALLTWPLTAIFEWHDLSGLRPLATAFSAVVCSRLAERSDGLLVLALATGGVVVPFVWQVADVGCVPSLVLSLIVFAALGVPVAAALRSLPEGWTSSYDVFDAFWDVAVLALLVAALLVPYELLAPVRRMWLLPVFFVAGSALVWRPLLRRGLWTPIRRPLAHVFLPTAAVVLLILEGHGLVPDRVLAVALFTTGLARRGWRLTAAAHRSLVAGRAPAERRARVDAEIAWTVFAAAFVAAVLVWLGGAAVFASVTFAVTALFVAALVALTGVGA